mgnify:CR=1 FL=1|jgi:predicted tellurium resistance membrane protein TerC
MLLFIADTLTESISWIAAGVALLLAVLLILMLWIHRKNTYERITKMEEKMQEHDEILYRQMEMANEKFKTALQIHLSEMTNRMAKNEDLTNRMINQMEDLKDLLLNEDSPPPKA